MIDLLHSNKQAPGLVLVRLPLYSPVILGFATSVALVTQMGRSYKTACSFWIARVVLQRKNSYILQNTSLLSFRPCMLRYPAKFWTLE